MKLPKLDDLLPEQSKVYDHPDDKHLFVAGPPGSGKTTLAVLRAIFLTDLGQNVLLITKNRMLAALGKELGANTFKTSTMHSYVWKHYRAIFGADIPSSAPYRYDWMQALDHYTAKGTVPSLDHIVIDEGQNLPPGLFLWALQVGAKTLTVFADEDQTTNTDRSSLQNICDVGLPAPVSLTRNHRNTPEIAHVAEHFHKSNKLPPGIIERPPTGDIPELLSIKDWADLVDRVATRFANRNESIGVIVQSAYDAKKVHELLRTEIPANARVNVYTKDTSKGAEFGIRLLDPGVTVLTGESVIGLEFECVYLQDLRRSLPCVSQEDYRRMYMLCARPRNALFLVNGPESLSAGQIAELPPPKYLSR